MWLKMVRKQLELCGPEPRQLAVLASFDEKDFVDVTPLYRFTSGHEPLDNPCSPMDVSATVLDSIGIRPETTFETPSGRPLPVIAAGRAILDVLV